MTSLVRVSLDLFTVGHCRHCERVTRRGGSLRSVSFPAVCALIVHPVRGPVLFDTGYADRFMDATRPFPERLYRWVTPVELPPEERLERRLAERGLRPEDIGQCLLSHFHADHVAGARDLPKARFVAPVDDLAILARSGRWRGLANGFLPALLPDDFPDRAIAPEKFRPVALSGAWADLSPGFDLFDDGSVLAISLPGHTGSQMGLLLRDQCDREVFLCADACWSARAWRELAPPSMLARPLMADWKAYMRTLARIHALGTKHPELCIVPSHCGESLAQWQRGARAAAGSVVS